MNMTVLTTICYIEKDGKTLMLYRNKKKNDVHEGKYVGIGGKFEFGETPEECIIREIKEETGLTVNSLRYHGLISFPKFANDDKIMLENLEDVAETGVDFFRLDFSLETPEEVREIAKAYIETTENDFELSDTAEKVLNKNRNYTTAHFYKGVE